ncbi:MAG: alpha/beta fold hydrolase [Pseudomonadota bacterium]
MHFRFTEIFAYINHAVTRRLRSEDYIQVGKTHYDTIYQDRIMSVRAYPPLEEKCIVVDSHSIPVSNESYAIPVVLVPPLGVYSWVFDLLVERSFVRFLLAHGFKVYVIDWGSPRPQDSNLRLTDYVNNWMPKAITSIQHHSNSKDVSLVGYCLGGLIALMYTAIASQPTATNNKIESSYENISPVVNLVTLASPINFHGKDWVGRFSVFAKGPMKSLRRLIPNRSLKFFGAEKLRNRLFHVRGKTLSMAFRATDPIGSIKSYLKLLQHMADKEYVIGYMNLSEWFTHMSDFPGGTIHDLLQYFGVDNRLMQGEFKVGKAKAQLSDIQSRLLVIAGDTDTIVSVDAAKHLLNLVGSTDTTFLEEPGGHAGVLGGKLASTHTWTDCVDWLKTRSS